MLFDKGMLNPWQPRANALIGTGVIGGLHPGRIPGLYSTAAVGPEAAYVAALIAAGATVTAPKQAAISSFMSAEIAAGRWDGIKRLYFPVWGLAAANAICMKSLATGTWTGGAVTHAAGYVQSSFSGGYMDTNTTFGSIGITKDSYHFAVVYKTSPFGGDNYNDRSFGVTNTYTSFNDGEPEIVLANTYLSVLVNTPYSILSIFGNSSSGTAKNRISISAVQERGTSGALGVGGFTDQNVWFLKSNGYSPASSAQTAAFSMGLNMSEANDLAYTLALKTLWETVTGLTLP